MNINKFLYIVLSVLIMTLFFNLITNPSKEAQEDAYKIFQEIVNRDVEKLSIVISRHGDNSYLMINDKKIINEFMDALKNGTYMPRFPTSQYNYSYVITIHSRNNSDLLFLKSDTFNDSIDSYSVEVTLFNVKNINIFDLYYKSKVKDIEFFSLFTHFYGHGKYNLRNHQLYNVINKYIKGKGLVYNLNLMKWGFPKDSVWDKEKKAVP